MKVDSGPAPCKAAGRSVSSTPTLREVSDVLDRARPLVREEFDAPHTRQRRQKRDLPCFAPLSKAIHCHFEVNLTKAMRCKRWILEGCDDRQMIAFSKPFLTQQVIYNETICEFFETPRTFAMNQGSATTEITLPTNLSPGRPLSVQTFGLTDPGRVRHSNEDQFFIAELAKAMKVLYTSMPQPTTQHSDERGYLFIVADGMGGHRAGEHASALAVETIETFVLNTLKWFFMLKGGDDLNILKEFQTALQQADAKVCQEAAQHSEFAGMGTTVTMAHSIGSRLFVVHVAIAVAIFFAERSCIA